MSGGVTAFVGSVRSSLPEPARAVYEGVIDDAVGGTANPSVSVRGVTDQDAIPCHFLEGFGERLRVQGRALIGRHVLVATYAKQPYVLDLIGG